MSNDVFVILFEKLSDYKLQQLKQLASNIGISVKDPIRVSAQKKKPELCADISYKILEKYISNRKKLPTRNSVEKDVEKILMKYQALPSPLTKTLAGSAGIAALTGPAYAGQLPRNKCESFQGKGPCELSFSDYEGENLRDCRWNMKSQFCEPLTDVKLRRRATLQVGGDATYTRYQQDPKSIGAYSSAAILPSALDYTVSAKTRCPTNNQEMCVKSADCFWNSGACEAIPDVPIDYNIPSKIRCPKNNQQVCNSSKDCLWDLSLSTCKGF